MLYYRRLTSENSPDYTYFAAPSDFWPDSCWLTNYRWDPTCATDLKLFDGWSSSDFQTCGSYKILGGYGKMGSGYTLEKTFSSLPPHSMMEVNLDFFCIDSWDTEYFYVSVDNVQIHSGSHDFRWNLGSQMCGDSYVDNIYPITATAYHTSSSATIRIWTNLNQGWNDESFGIKNFVVYLTIPCTKGCLTCSSPSYCTSCPYHSKLVGGDCICKNHYYMRIDTWVHCHPCAVTCKTCNSLESNACIDCYEGYQLSSGSCVPKTSKNNVLKLRGHLTHCLTKKSLYGLGPIT